VIDRTARPTKQFRSNLAWSGVDTGGSIVFIALPFEDIVG